MLKLSLIIPVYNEERHIRACLDAVADQTVMPDEVIVVDNNCTDKTIEIAKSYNFVKIIKENNQGRGHARSAGFNTAKYDILGRIDADSRIAKNWVELVLATFSQEENLYGLTGLGITEVIPFVKFIKSKLFSRAYYWFVHSEFNTITMWGANMAIRKSAWAMVKDDVILDDDKVHEDQDISLWMATLGLRITQNNAILISTRGNTYRYLPKYLHYYFLYRKTRTLHRRNGNLNSPKLIRLGFLRTFPGRIGALFAAICIIAMGLIFYPIDSYIVLKNRRNIK